MPSTSVEENIEDILAEFRQLRRSLQPVIILAMVQLFLLVVGVVVAVGLVLLDSPE